MKKENGMKNITLLAVVLVCVSTSCWANSADSKKSEVLKIMRDMEAIATNIKSGNTVEFIATAPPECISFFYGAYSETDPGYDYIFKDISENLQKYRDAIKVCCELPSTEACNKK